MASSSEYVAYVCEQLRGSGAIRFRKMFGDYMVYVNDKPLVLVCDDTPYLKIVPELENLMADAEIGVPYEGARPHYILDIDDAERVRAAAAILEPITPVPRAKKARAKRAGAKGPGA